MKKLNEDIIAFFQRQPFVIISSIDKKGYPHNACKGIVDIDKSGRIYLLDLYKARTYENIKSNPQISITAVDEHKFIGYCLKGRADIIKEKQMSPWLIELWEKRITKRISHRLLKNLQGQKGHASHPEALLPRPAYLIEVEVQEVTDLSPFNKSISLA